MFSLRNLVYFSLYAMPSFVSARFTSTFPSANTIIKGDTEVILKWTYTPENTTNDPFESTKGLCDLMWGDQAYRVALLAQNVNFYDNELKVFIRADYGFNSSQYFIRYRSQDQKGLVYSDRFTLTDMDGPDFSLNATSHGSGGPPPVASQVYATSTAYKPVSGFTAAGTSTLDVSSAPYYHPQGDEPIEQYPTFPYPPPSAPTETAKADIQSNGSSALSLARQRDSAWKKISILLWPVLVGAVMAM
ncbi:hypothetical protein FRC07_008594 [Ceratobasidium sp. 392]|nr:hypothetical protein FRC07_008594 [Ceratobasidium sp. 392]